MIDRLANTREMADLISVYKTAFIISNSFILFFNMGFWGFVVVVVVVVPFGLVFLYLRFCGTLENMKYEI